VDAGALILGIDGGGSKTTAWLARADGSVVGRGRSGPSNPKIAGVEAARRNLDAAVDAAFAEARAAAGTVASACVALAGADRDEMRAEIERWARGRSLAQRLRVAHDGEPVLAAGTPGGCGIALIAGTGSFAFGRNSDGRTARCGGWGPIFGDEGSGVAIATAGLRAAAQAADGRGPSTTLLDRFMKRLGIGAPAELVAAIYPSRGDAASLASMAEVVLGAADAEDPVAQGIVADAARELAEMADALSERLDLELDEDSFALACAGGLLVNSERLRAELMTALEEFGLKAEPVGIVPEPAAGAVILARQIGGAS
jgi:N-acetylglucosamine kinase-like BadF-type ATPase